MFVFLPACVLFRFLACLLVCLFIGVCARVCVCFIVCLLPLCLCDDRAWQKCRRLAWLVKVETTETRLIYEDVCPAREG